MDGRCSRAQGTPITSDDQPEIQFGIEIGAGKRVLAVAPGFEHTQVYHPLYLQDKANNFSTSRYALRCRTSLHFPTLFCPVLHSTALLLTTLAPDIRIGFDPNAHCSPSLAFSAIDITTCTIIPPSTGPMLGTMGAGSVPPTPRAARPAPRR